jgi:hypothetical protein
MYIVIGGKAKPLKQPKREKKELDEEDQAFKAKKAAGNMIFPRPLRDQTPNKATEEKARKEAAEKLKKGKK